MKAIKPEVSFLPQLYWYLQKGNEVRVLIKAGPEFFYRNKRQHVPILQEMPSELMQAPVEKKSSAENVRQPGNWISCGHDFGDSMDPVQYQQAEEGIQREP